jgi:hypothetical protein
VNSQRLNELCKSIRENDEYVPPIVAETRWTPAEYPEPRYRYNDNEYEYAEEAIEALMDDHPEALDDDLPDLINSLIWEM